MSLTAAIQQSLETFWKYKTDTMWTACPAVILAVYPDEQRMDVQPAIRHIFNDGDTQDYPVILGVPYIYPSSSKAVLTFPLVVGDSVLVVFSKLNTDTFKSGDGSITDPHNWRKFDVQDAIAIPGLFPFSQAPNKSSLHSFGHSSTDVALVQNLGETTQAELRLKEDGSISLKTALAEHSISSEGTILSKSGVSLIEVSPLKVVIDAPTVIINDINFSLHTHTSAAPGSATSPPIPPIP